VTTGRIIDLFAGPGGWSEGLRMLGCSELGIEHDEAACATARAAGHERLQADVAVLDPRDFAPCRGLIASPPCQAFSVGGKGGGRRDVEHVIACALEIAAGGDTRAEHAAKCEDPRSMLVVEPLRWVVALRPEWVALEQVPPVLKLWSPFAQILDSLGYSSWTGVLEAERFGVPQTRERAVLMASRVRAVVPPRPTHQRYVPKEPQRHEVTFEGDVLPWVSMAEALGWDTDDVMRSNYSDGATGERGERDASEPGFAVTGKVGRNFRVVMEMHRGAGMTERHGERPPRELAEPAFAITARSKGSGPRQRWVQERPSTTVNGDPRINEPGRHDPNESGSQQKNAIRVTVQEAAILQGFRHDYPWQGTRTKQFEQVGNAVPPLLARAVLGELVDVQVARDAA